MNTIIAASGTKNLKGDKMRTAMRGLIGLVGIFNLALGLGFLFDPVKLGESFFLSPTGTQGLATLRGDFSGFFVGAALFALCGAYYERADLLLVPLGMLAIADAGRAFSLIVDGASPIAFQPMIAEWIMIALLLTGYRVFGGATRTP
jgi:hypothetical protein